MSQCTRLSFFEPFVYCLFVPSHTRYSLFSCLQLVSYSKIPENPESFVDTSKYLTHGLEPDESRARDERTQECPSFSETRPSSESFKPTRFCCPCCAPENHTVLLFTALLTRNVLPHTPMYCQISIDTANRVLSNYCHVEYTNSGELDTMKSWIQSVYQSTLLSQDTAVTYMPFSHTHPFLTATYA